MNKLHKLRLIATFWLTLIFTGCNSGANPAPNGGFLTYSQVPIINSAVPNPGGSLYVLNSGNAAATLESSTATPGISGLSGCSNGSILDAGESCIITFNVTQAGGTGTIQLDYNGGVSQSSISAPITWFNDVGGELVSMTLSNPISILNDIPLQIPVTVTNIGGYNLTGVMIPTPIVLSGNAVASIDANGNTCAESPASLSVGATCQFILDVSDNTVEVNQQIMFGFNSTYTTTGIDSNNYSRLEILTYTAFTPVVYLPQTGESPTSPINPATLGMDGYTYTGIPWAYAPGGTTTPTTRFTVGSGAESNCITDNLTGLMWVKDLNTLAINESGANSWQDALASIADANLGSGYCGYTDWFLPTINDLSSLINLSAINPSAWLLSQGFVNIQNNANTSYYWSSTAYVPGPGMAMSVFIFYGILTPLNESYSGLYVWPVRVNPAAFAAAPAQVPATGESGGAPGSANGVSWPSQRFVAGSGAESNCVTDTLTGLIWPINGSIGFSSTAGGIPNAQPDYTNTNASLNALSWNNAITAIGNMNAAPIQLCGYNDWRLPNKNEMVSLYNFGALSPANWLMYGNGSSDSPVCSGTCFNNVVGGASAYYWSSSVAAFNTNLGWALYMNESNNTPGLMIVGTAGRKGFLAGSLQVWPVRGGQ